MKKCIAVWTCASAYRDLTYQAELGLQLNLQGLQGPLELSDLTFGGREGLYASCHLLVQFVKLEDMKLDMRIVETLYRRFVNHLIFRTLLQLNAGMR